MYSDGSEKHTGYSEYCCYREKKKSTQSDTLKSESSTSSDIDEFGFDDDEAQCKFPTIYILYALLYLSSLFQFERYFEY